MKYSVEDDAVDEGERSNDKTCSCVKVDASENVDEGNADTGLRIRLSSGGRSQAERVRLGWGRFIVNRPI